MDRVRKLELIQRSLGIRHKLKVHDSMKAPDSHEDMAVALLSKWELEDELRAIEEILAEARSKNVLVKRKVIDKTADPELAAGPLLSRAPAKEPAGKRKK